MRAATGERAPITTASHTSRGMTGPANAPMYARSAKTPKATSAMASITLDLEEDGAGRGARRARDRRGVEGDLTPVLAEAARDLDVGLEVDDGPDPVLQERRVDHPFDHDAVVEP